MITYYHGGLMKRIGPRVYWQGKTPTELPLKPGTLEQDGMWLSMEVEGWETKTISVNRQGLDQTVTFVTTVAASMGGRRMKPGISFWVQPNPEDGGFVGLTSYSCFLSSCADTELEALVGIIEVTLACLEDTEVSE